MLYRSRLPIGHLAMILEVDSYWLAVLTGRCLLADAERRPLTVCDCARVRCPCCEWFGVWATDDHGGGRRAAAEEAYPTAGDHR